MTVLFVESGAGVGGSVVSLHYLVRGLVARGIDAVVVFPVPHAMSDRFRDAGARVIHEREHAAGRSAAPSAAGAGTPEDHAAGAAREAAAPAPRPSRPAPSWTESGAYRTLSFYKCHITGHAAAVRAWRSRIAAVGPDLVYLNNELPLNFHVADAARSLGLPVIAHLRGVKPLRLPHRRFAPHLSAGIAISDFVRDHYLAAGFPAGLVHRVHNGIDPAEYPFVEPAAAIPPDGGSLLFLGRLAGWKGADTLLEAAARLARTRSKITVTVAGDGPVRGDMEARAAALGLGGRVRFTGFVARTLPLLRAADLLVHTSTEPEPFGRVLLEGMASGVPVVASDLGATREIVTDGVDGFLAPAGDAAALATRIETVLASGDRAAIARRARVTVETRFTTEQMVDGVHARIRAALAPSPGGAR